MNKRLYVDLHVLQTVPPSCVNRDDTGSPKTAVYGGVRRARVSSQAWKRAMRTMFREELLNPEQVGERTKKVLQILAEEIQRTAPEQEAEKLAKKAMEYAGLTPSKKNGNDLDALFFLSHFQAKALASLIVEGSSDKKAYHDALEKAPSMDMALFGRMVASDPSLNYDASAQVAHSISTHRVQNEYDYFTAVDDCAPEDNAGAGHLGTVEYNSATLYRYATVNLLELAGYLGKEDAVKAVEVFAEAFIRSMPTGKQNTFANRTLPDVVYITLRDDQPVNLCGAFEQAVPSTANGYVEASKQRFVSYTEQVYADYTGKPQIAFTVGKGWEGLAAPLSLRAMLDELSKAVSQQLGPCEVS